MISIQAAWLLADHAHSRSTLTVTCPVPPAGVKLEDGPAIESWQRAGVGPVTLVVVELPHATENAAADKANSRGRTNVFTAVAPFNPRSSRIEACDCG